MFLTDKVVLITGGTGSFGKKFVEIVLQEQRPKKLIVFSRDELKQHEMRQIYPDTFGSNMRYFIGDVRDLDRLMRAFRGVDYVVHAAALKQVPACEYNPFEAVKTNILGAKNVIDAAIDRGVKKVVALSTDKAVNPVNLYGATKLCAEKVFIRANAYSGSGGTQFAVVRYGNVVGSRGSVIPLFLQQKASGVITVTDPRMTRFWITVEQGVRSVLHCLERTEGGEIYVPKIPSVNIMDLAQAIAPECEPRFIGIRPGEKLHETLVSEDESRHTVETEQMYVIRPPYSTEDAPVCDGEAGACEGFKYTSDYCARSLSVEDLQAMVQPFIYSDRGTGD